jgi:hypothetical protein
MSRPNEKYSEFTDKVECNSHFTAAGWNCMTHHQVLQCFPDMSQNNKINLPMLQQLLLGVGK